MMKRAKVPVLGNRVPTADFRRALVPQKQAESFYQTPEFKAWRTEVLSRAGWRCQAIVKGLRCRNSYPEHRMFADHIVERRDGGSDLDPANGQCLCAGCHNKKTYAEKARRMATYGQKGPAL